MLVKLTQDVSTSFTKTAKGGYSTAEVTYEGGKKPFKLVSFSNPAVFEVFKNAKAGEAYEVESSKDDSGFYKWTSAKKVDSNAVPAQSAGTQKAAWSAGPDPRETPDERKARQRLIVRQSSLANAVTILAHANKEKIPIEAVTGLADQLTAWVYEAPDLFDEPNDLTEA